MNEDAVGAAPAGDAPTTSEWSTIVSPSKVWLILDVWQYNEIWNILKGNIVIINEWIEEAWHHHCMWKMSLINCSPMMSYGAVDTKPLPQPMLTYHQLNIQDHLSENVCKLSTILFRPQCVRQNVCWWPDNGMSQGISWPSLLQITEVQFIKGINSLWPSDALGDDTAWVSYHFSDNGHQGPCNPYKPCNHNLHIGIIGDDNVLGQHRLR